MKVLVIGSGGREHALAWKLAQSGKVTEIFIAPGNAGTAQIGQNVDIAADDVLALLEFAKTNNIDLTVGGSEAAITRGIADTFKQQGLLIFAPSKAASEIESSKIFAKNLMKKYDIPCAKSQSFDEYQRAKAYLQEQSLPIVVKADGLAAGKGVVVAQTMAEAQKALADMMVNSIFGTAGHKVLIEECLSGPEMSFFAFVDGNQVVPLASACDYKRIFDNNQGPNTGGMGSYSPPIFITEELKDYILKQIVQPVAEALVNEKCPYQGMLYTGLMITPDGPKVLEFNARFGDPETQVLLPLLDSDLFDIFYAIARGMFKDTAITVSDDACVGVVMAAKGYPSNPQKGQIIHGIEEVDYDVNVFHAGTKNCSGRFITNGGRVLIVCARGRNLEEARTKVYENIAKISFDGAHYRKDIAFFANNKKENENNG
ncbi:MAG: phosphoribosylamine--glycine ligase [Chloroflexi bacterium]|nr:phosphoribosylamine--glycine ligase [Chloroflexota bacterium]